MPSYSKNEVVLVRYPFSDLSGSKVRPAVVINTPHASQDVIIVPLTSKTTHLLAGEFIATELERRWLECRDGDQARHLYNTREAYCQKRRNVVRTRCGKFRTFPAWVDRLALKS